MAEPFPEGSRVRVKIVHPERYAVGSADALNGRVGTVEREIAEHWWGMYKGPARLVRFDNPAPATWSGGSPIAAFHFELSELEAYK